MIKIFKNSEQVIQVSKTAGLCGLNLRGYENE
jgi:hypothetical protein